MLHTVQRATIACDKICHVEAFFFFFLVINRTLSTVNIVWKFRLYIKRLPGDAQKIAFCLRPLISKRASTAANETSKASFLLEAVRSKLLFCKAFCLEKKFSQISLFFFYYNLSNSLRAIYLSIISISIINHSIYIYIYIYKEEISCGRAWTQSRSNFLFNFIFSSFH